MMKEKTVVAEAAHKYGIDPKILWGVYGTETSFGKNISRSSAGAEGPFQFMPGTAKSLGVNPHDFRSAAFGAAKYLSQFKDRGVGGMLSAYNAGPAGGYQSDYVQKTLNNAHAFGKGPISQDVHTQAAAHGVSPEVMNHLYSPDATPEPTFDKAAFQKALVRSKGSEATASLFSGSGAGDTALRSALRIPMPNPQDFQRKGEIIKTPEGTLAVQHGQPNPHASNNLHGILPEGAKIKEMNRKDQGRDVQLEPGQKLLAPGKFVFEGTKSDPTGFGPSYPIIRVLTGEFAGHYLYYGHTDSAPLQRGKVYPAGTHVATTSRTGHNAKPGWLELGYAPGGTPGPFGQRVPF